MDTILCYLLQKKDKLSSFKDKLIMTNIQKLDCQPLLIKKTWVSVVATVQLGERTGQGQKAC